MSPPRLKRPTVVQQNDLLLKMLDQMKQDQDKARDESRQSRAAMHARTDELIERVGRIETSIAISGQIDAQVRAELDQVKQLVQSNHAEIEPTVAAWKQLLATGSATARIFSIAGITTLGGLVAALASVSGAGESAWHWLLKTLRLG